MELIDYLFFSFLLISLIFSVIMFKVLADLNTELLAQIILNLGVL
jgi:hypothetical protein